MISKRKQINKRRCNEPTKTMTTTTKEERREIVRVLFLVRRQKTFVICCARCLCFICILALLV